jgi:diguanylate cyclase (GGDEF)-like protein
MASASRRCVCVQALRSKRLTGKAVTFSRDSSFGLDSRIDQIERAAGGLVPWLRFPAELEQAFQTAAYARRLRMISAAHVAAVILFAGLLVPDLLLMPDVFPLGLAIRLLAFPAIVLVGSGVLFRLQSARANEWAVPLMGMAAMSLDLAPLLSTQSPHAFIRTVESNLIVVFTCTVARFWPALVACLFAACMHALEMYLLPDATGVLKFCLSLLLSASMLFTLYATYKMELDERLAYLLGQREAVLDEALRIEHDRVARLATEDALTGVANRRSFEHYLRDSLVRAGEQGQHLSLIMIDIDHFKRYNDHHGHQAGDRCLQAVARGMSGALRRPVDLVARLGGEEFAVVMPDADGQAALAAAERVRQAVLGLSLSHPASSTCPVVSISLGVATLRPAQPFEAKELDDVAARFLHEADQALYRAKARGRNRACADEALSDATAAPITLAPAVASLFNPCAPLSAPLH